MTQNNANLCILKSYSSLEELLTKELLFSKNFLKRTLPKNYLSKEIREKDELYIDQNILNRGFINPNSELGEIEVLNENDNYVAFNKPSGIHGHPHEYGETNTVLNYIRSNFCFEHLSFIQKSSESTLLYRLDRDTSGVLIFAKNMNSYEEIRKSFSSATREKQYLAIVDGKFDKEGEHFHDLVSSGEKGSKMKALKSSEKSVCIETLNLSYNEDENVSLVLVKLGKGVRHQIRCQLSAIGFPILGDSLYGGREEKRLFLHAYKYSFDSFSAESRQEKSFLRFFNLDSCL